MDDPQIPDKLTPSVQCTVKVKHKIVLLITAFQDILHCPKHVQTIMYAVRKCPDYIINFIRLAFVYLQACMPRQMCSTSSQKHELMSNRIVILMDLYSYIILC